MDTTPKAKITNGLTIEFTHNDQVLELTVGFDQSGPLFYRSVNEVVDGKPVNEVMRDDDGVSTVYAVERWAEEEGYPVNDDFFAGLRNCTAQG